MTTIRERLADAFLGDQKRQLQGVVRDLIGAYQAGPFELATSPDQLKATLREYDAALVQDLVNEIEWEKIGVMGYDTLFSTEARRTRAVKESRRLWIYDVVTAFIIQLWTDFGFGENVTVEPSDPKAAEVWAAYWKADENDAVLAADNLHALSETVLADGDLFLAYYIAKLDGKTTVRVVDSLEITEIITDPDDGKTPLFYKRQYVTPGSPSRTAYYPAWMPWLKYQTAKGEAKVDPYAGVADKIKDDDRADKAGGERYTAVVMQHCAYKRKGGLRGWPLMTAGAPWSREHRRFRENRAAIAAAMAQFIQKVKVKGGTRAVDAIRAKLQSSLAASGSTDAFERNPPGAPGSTWLENDAAELTRLPLSTNASDAQFDGGALLMMAGLGGGVYPHWLGAGEAFRLATATAMEAPMHRQFSRYKLFWGEQFRRMLKIVLAFDSLYGSRTQYEDTGAEVSTDRLIEIDLEMISEAVSSLVTSSLQPYFEAGLIDEQTTGGILQAIWFVALQALGVEDPKSIAPPAGFGVDEVAQESAMAEGRKAKARRPFVSGLAFLREARRELVTMGEVSHQGDYEAGLKAAARALWSATWTRGEALDGFGLQIETGLRWAWIEGTEAAGISRAEQTAEDLEGADAAISAELQHLPGLLDFIEENSKANGGKLDTVLTRIGIWANGYNRVMNAAMAVARNNPKLKWRLGATKEHCTDCAGYNGKVYRAKTWEKWGAIPQSQDLECSGYNCDCKLDPTSDPITPGRPRSPSGG